MIQITVNGQRHTIASTKLAELIQELHIQTKHLAVAVNNHVIPSAEQGKCALKNGDQIEIVTPMCGG